MAHKPFRPPRHSRSEFSPPLDETLACQTDQYNIIHSRERKAYAENLRSPIPPLGIERYSHICAIIGPLTLYIYIYILVAVSFPGECSPTQPSPAMRLTASEPPGSWNKRAHRLGCCWCCRSSCRQICLPACLQALVHGRRFRHILDQFVRPAHLAGDLGCLVL